MDPIEAQIQAGLQQIASQPGFEGYRPSFEQPTAMINESLSLEPMGVPTPQDLGGLKDIAIQAGKNVIKNQALQYAGKKLGLNQIATNALGNVFGLSQLANPIGIAAMLPSALTGRSLNLSQALQAKRTQKAIERNIMRDTQGDIQTNNVRILNMQPSAQDRGMGMGGKTSVTSSTPSSGGGGPYSGGVGGIHSGY